MTRLTKELEKYLGPSTGDLRARVGMHSGPITAGVLRGNVTGFAQDAHALSMQQLLF